MSSAKQKMLNKYFIVLQVLTCVTLAWSAELEHENFVFQRIGNGSYYFSDRQRTWYDAVDACRSAKSELVGFETNAEYDDVATHVAKIGRVGIFRRHYWTSGNNLPSESQHTWLSNGKRIDINRWAFNQPDNFMGKEHCIEMGFIYPLLSVKVELNDRNCYTPRNFICQRSNE